MTVVLHITFCRKLHFYKHFSKALLPWTRYDESAITISHPCALLLLLFLFFLGNQAVTQGKNKLPHVQYTLGDKDFYRIGKSFK